MSNVINLNKFRKSKQRQERRAAADENAVKFGRSKVEKTRNAAESAKSERDLDGHNMSAKDENPES